LTKKEANYYQNYISSFKGAKITVLPTMDFPLNYNVKRKTPYMLAEYFMKQAEIPGTTSYLDDLFNQKKELSEDRVNLVLEEITGREDSEKRTF